MDYRFSLDDIEVLTKDDILRNTTVKEKKSVSEMRYYLLKELDNKGYINKRDSNVINSHEFINLYSMDDEMLGEEWLKHRMNDDIVTRNYAIRRIVTDKKITLLDISEASDEHINELALLTNSPDIKSSFGDKMTLDYFTKLRETAKEDKKTPIMELEYFHWVILIYGQVIGYVGYHPMIKRCLEEKNGEKLSPNPLQIRYFINDNYQGLGYVSFALDKSIYLLREFGVQRDLYSMVDVMNTKSLNLMDNQKHWINTNRDYILHKKLHVVYRYE